MTRRNPYGQALTLAEYLEIEPDLKRPLTGGPIKVRHAHTDARLSRLVQPCPRATHITPKEVAA